MGSFKSGSEQLETQNLKLETQLKLRNPIYSETAAYGHMGRKNETVTKQFEGANGEKKTLQVELFTWEKLDFVDKIKAEFGL